MILNYNHATGKVHTLTCRTQARDDSLAGAYLVEQFELGSHGYPYDPRGDVLLSTSTLLTDLLGDRIAQCCLGPLIRQLRHAEDRDLAERLTDLDAR